MNALNSGKTNFQSVSDATLAEMFVLPAHAKSACLTTTIPALLKRRLKQVLKRAISTSSVHSMLPADVPIAANVQEFALKIFRFIFSIANSSRTPTNFTASIRQARTQTAASLLLILIITIANRALFMREEDKSNEKDFYVTNRLSF